MGCLRYQTDPKEWYVFQAQPLLLTTIQNDMSPNEWEKTNERTNDK